MRISECLGEYYLDSLPIYSPEEVLQSIRYSTSIIVPDEYAEEFCQAGRKVERQMFLNGKQHVGSRVSKKTIAHLIEEVEMRGQARKKTLAKAAEEQAAAPAAVLQSRRPCLMVHKNALQYSYITSNDREALEARFEPEQIDAAMRVFQEWMHHEMAHSVWPAPAAFRKSMHGKDEAARIEEGMMRILPALDHWDVVDALARRWVEKTGETQVKSGDKVRTVNTFANDLKTTSYWRQIEKLRALAVDLDGIKCQELKLFAMKEKLSAAGKEVDRDEKVARMKQLEAEIKKRRGRLDAAIAVAVQNNSKTFRSIL